MAVPEMDDVAKIALLLSEMRVSLLRFMV